MTRSRRLGTLVLAFLVAGCSAQAVAPRPSDTPESTPSATATARATNASSDIVYVRSNDGLSATILGEIKLQYAPAILRIDSGR